MRFSELDGTAVGVWGAGREIASLARQLERRLHRAARIAVIAADARPDGSVDDGVRALAAATGAQIVSGPAAVDALAACGAVVRSPGVSIHRPELFALRAGGTPVTTATSLWLAERGGAGVIGVTGTKGKSTTAALIAHLARAAGVSTDLAGNIGVPALDLLDAPPSELAVIELSSYQIADLAIGAEVAVVTNLYREHVDWHGSEEAYQADKLRLLTLPGVRVAVVGAVDGDASGGGAAGGEALGGDAAAEAARIAGDARAATVAREAGVALAPFGGPGGWHVTAAGIAREAGGEIVVPTGALPLRGAHNAQFLCTALTALEAAGVALPPLPRALDGFRALPHRLEPVGERDGLLFVDDSISTTPESAVAALDSYADRAVVLLAFGRQDRSQDYAPARARAGAARRCRRRAAEHGRAGRRGGARGGRAGRAGRRRRGMEEAVALARRLAAQLAADSARTDVAARTDAAVVLLSPAAPSYDFYRDFIARGERFRAAVEAG